MNPANARTSDPWIAAYLERALRSWGLGVVIVLVALSFAWIHADRYLASKATVEESNAATFHALSVAMGKLTDATERTEQFRRSVEDAHVRQTDTLQNLIRLIEMLTAKIQIHEEANHEPGKKTTWLPSPAEIERFREGLRMPKEVPAGSR